jgi:hypothetical protein
VYSGFCTSGRKTGPFGAERQQPDAARIVQVLVEHTGNPGRFQRADERPRALTPAEGKELHEQPLVQPLLLALPDAALLADVGGFRSTSHSLGHTFVTRSRLLSIIRRP